MIGMNKRLLEAYEQFLLIRANISMQVTQDRIAPYDWYKLPDKLSPLWMAFTFMLDEHSRGISNSINEFLRYIDNLEAWGNIIKVKNDNEKFEIIIEFIAPITTLAINMPYVIRSRFIYSVVHLCHQSNFIKGITWESDIPIENEICFNVASKYCSKWINYGKLKKSLETIANNKYKIETKDFRNKYNHRYTLGIEFGKTEFIKRIGKSRYALGHTDPLKIEELLPVLTGQHIKCLNALKEYKQLVEEQISAIEKYERSQSI
jgi:hypothetical protein